MQYPRVNFSWALSPSGAYVYVFGGVSLAGDILQSVERYSITEDSWEILSTVLDCALVDSVAVTMPDGIYLLGGSSSLAATDSASRKVLRFDLEEHKTQSMCEMRVARSAF